MKIGSTYVSSYHDEIKYEVYMDEDCVVALQEMLKETARTAIEKDNFEIACDCLSCWSKLKEMIRKGKEGENESDKD